MSDERYQERLRIYQEKLRIDKELEELSKKDSSELSDNELTRLWYGNPLANFKVDKEYISPHRNEEAFKLYCQGMAYGDSLINGENN